MTEDPIFDSRDGRYKTPYGAVPSGTRVSFTLRPPRSGGYSRGVLTARFEFWDDREIELPMPWSGLDGARDLFSCTLETEGYLGLVWYSFRLERLDGQTLALPEHQLTVYDGTQEAPGWFGAGMSYQIFPDRFRRTAVPDPTGMVGGRWVHAGWYEEPEWRPDARGEIRNRDFFGGSLAGVMEKLDYLASLGVETLYFCPIFEAAENHRYGTGDYEKVDPMLGTNEDFSILCAAARARGMHVMLDGVFNHQGFVSRYFNGDGAYPGLGAHQSKGSPYYPWYHFTHYPDKYDAWWGIYSLPAVNESDPGYMDYIIENEDSIIRRWLRAGADGWRLDVADELPDEFIRRLHAAARSVKPEAVIIGEVWEDGSNKIAYSVRRRHLQGGYLDGLMNYPFRNALLDFLLHGNAAGFRESMETIRENYPPSAFYSAMNALGTHDTPRILTLLGTGGKQPDSREERARHRMTEAERDRGLALLRLGFLVLFAFPGSPTVYYGDEVGMEGFEDPFNRRCFPWGNEDAGLTAWVSALGNARKTLEPLRRGELAYVKAEGAVLAFTRTCGGDAVLCAANAGEESVSLELPWPCADLLDGSGAYSDVTLPPLSGKLLRKG